MNGLGYCTQEVMAAVESMKASTGSSTSYRTLLSQRASSSSVSRIICIHAQSNCGPRAEWKSGAGISELAQRLELLAAEVLDSEPALESLERTLTVMEEKMFALLVTSASESELTALREEAARELAPYRSRMQSAQIRQVEQQFLHKKLSKETAFPG